MKSYLNKTFLINDAQARIRKDDDLLAFVKENGVFKLIPNGSQISVTDTTVGRDSAIYVRADGWGWTAAKNLKNQFLNETLRAIPPADDDPKGANAAWDAGNFLRQITLIEIVGADHALKYISDQVATPYLSLVHAAADDGVPMPLRSGFRTYPKQLYLYNGYQNRLPRFNRAAMPGFSNHQDGFAYDFVISGYEENPRYAWLKAHAPAHGFVRTVTEEPWHWEYRPQVAATGVYKTSNVLK